MKLTKGMGLEKSENSADSTNKKDFLIERFEVKDSPFTIVKGESGRYFLVVGRYRVSDEVKTKFELEEMVKTKPWQLMTTVIGIMVEEIMNEREKNLIKGDK